MPPLLTITRRERPTPAVTPSSARTTIPVEAHRGTTAAVPTPVAVTGVAVMPAVAVTGAEAAVTGAEAAAISAEAAATGR